MKRGQSTSTEEKIEIALRVCEVYSEDKHTLEDCCRMNGVSVRAFYYWVDGIAEIAEAYKKAKREAQKAYHIRVREKAARSLEKLVEGYTVKTKKITWEPDPEDPEKAKIKQEIEEEKHVLPNPTLLIFALTNRDPENWKHKDRVEVHHHTEEGEFDISSWTEEERQRFFEQGRKALKKGTESEQTPGESNGGGGS
jgi:hypothetical protein